MHRHAASKNIAPRTSTAFTVGYGASTIGYGTQTVFQRYVRRYVEALRQLRDFDFARNFDDFARAGVA